MPTKFFYNGKEPFTLPRPFNKAVKPGVIGYLRDEVATVLTLLGGLNKKPAELVLEKVELSKVPANGFDDYDPFDDYRQASIETTGSGGDVIWTWTLPENSHFSGHFIFSAKNQDAAGHIRYERVLSAYHEGGVAAIDAGMPLTPTTDVDTIGVVSDPAFSVSGSILTVRVSGKAATNIQWNMAVDIVASSAAHN